MKKIVGSLVLFLLVLGSCKKNNLDINPVDRVGETALWTDSAFIIAYHNELYNAIPHGFYIHMYSKYTDEAYNAAPCCGADVFKLNNFTPDNIGGAGGGDFWGGYMYYWNYGYQYVRKINVFLEKMTDPKTVQYASKDLLVAEAKFLRAFVYFNLLERFGGVPIVTKVYGLGDQEVFKRNTIDEVVAFIEKDLNEAIPVLPASFSSSNANYGRATQDASYALLSRLLLYAASPLYNPTNDKAKWQKAADAAAVFINNGDRGYTLYPDYAKLFNQPSAAHQNEYIFARNFNSANGHQAPMHNLGRRYGAYGGWWASNGPSQNLVDDYDMTNGEPAFTWNGNTQTINPASGYDPNNPYANRDPRFEATVIHNGSVFRGDNYEMWVATDVNNKWGFDSYKQSSDNPRGGYILRKFMPEDGPLNWQTTFTIPWPFFRLAEIYLNYAEAKFELGDEATAREYVSKVRARVGMPAIPATVTGEALRQRIYNERRIELAFESHRFFDIRRWKIAGIIENRPIRGMDVLKNLGTGVTTYTPIVLLQKNPYQEKMNFLPVETAEVRRNSPDLQTPGW